MSPLSSSDHVVVVGAGFAGWRFAEALRREGFDGAVTLIGDEPYAPYDRPPLSKQVLVGKWDVGHATLATPENLAKADVGLHLGVAAVGLDVASTTVHLADGSEVAGTHVVIATGTRARRLSFSADADIHTLRDHDDVVGLLGDLARLDERDVVAVVGGGFIGAEVATQLHARGLQPIVLEAGERPLLHVLGPEPSAWLADLAKNAGVELRNGVQISDVGRDGEGFKVQFGDGTELHAAVVVEGAGAVVNDEWLATSGLTVDNGVVVDEHLLATDRIAAIGDVARFNWKSVTGDELVRIEHWEVANMHANALAHYWMTGLPPRTLLVPYFWSDQYGKKIQMLGHARPTDDVTLVSGSPVEGKWVAVYSREGVVTGLLALSHPRALMLSKHLLEAPTTLEAAHDEAPWAG
jgi:NADPH-dependent 2,4-dienoyl-CoA reductase/sulfur reductase-like enzyme